MKVAIPDWGESVWRRPQELYQLEDRFCEVSWQGLACSLAGIAPAFGVTWWPHKTRHLCRALMANQEGKIQIKKSMGPGSCLVSLGLRGGGLNVGSVDLKTTLFNLGHVRIIESLAIEGMPRVLEVQ